MSDDILVSAFARSHDITTEHAQAYAEGRMARRCGMTIGESRHITPADAWYRAGWHDADIDMGHSMTEVSA